MPSPICTVKDGAGSAQTTNAVTTVTPGNTVTLALADATGVSTWTIQCVYTDETQTAASVNSGLTVNGTTKTATFTAPAAGKAMIFQSVINGGLNTNAVTDSTYTTTFKVATLSNLGTYVVAANETVEHGSFGWLPVLNNASRYAQTSNVNTQTGTSYTITDANHLQTLVLNNASAISATLSASAKVGTVVSVLQAGAGRVTFAAASGGSLSNRLGYTKTAAQYAVVSLYVASNSSGSNAQWILSGDTAV